jgi:hypothetical protein
VDSAILPVDRAYSIAMERRAEAAWDVVLYGGSVLTALVVPLTTDVPLDREWARLAAPAYAAATFVAVALAVRRAGLMARMLLAAAVFAAVVIVPLGVHVADRADQPNDVHVKSDVLVIEEAAAALVAGENPYDASFDADALSSWPSATRTHFPYLPATLVFGIPRAVGGPGPFTDARVPFLAVTLCVAMVALAWSRVAPSGRLRAFQILLVAATGAPLVYTSGKELPVIALLLASLVALDRGRPVVAGVSAGVAASAHQLAWLLIPLLALAPAARSDRRRITVAAAATMAVSMVPFVLWDVRAFADDATLFPLGYGQPPNSNGWFTPGSALASVFPQLRWALVVLLGVVVTAWIGAFALRTPHASAAEVARRAGLLLLVALLLAPRTRIAYFAFPLNLLLWSDLLRRGRWRTTPTRELRPVAVGTASDPPG